MDRGDASNFSRLGTLGIEEEYFIVDSDGRPTAGTDELVYENEPPEPLQGRLDHELFKFVIEAQTPLITDPGDARDALLSMRNALVSYAETHGYQIAAAGLHPTARWRELEHAEKPRYRSQLDRIQYPQHRNVTAGLHIHVGVDDADKAVWVSNELRWYLPFLLALSANSPYWNGYDTGLQSARAKIFEGLPNTGMPTAFESFAEFDAFEETMLETESIRDRGELWYDVRPHTAHGSVEVRTPDAQTNPEHVLSFVEYVHTLVLDLCERYEDGEAGHDHRRELLDEQKWRAIRHGRETAFLDQELQDTISLTEFLEQESARLDTDALWSVYEAESGAETQRHIRDSAGVDALCDALVIDRS